MMTKPKTAEWGVLRMLNYLWATTGKVDPDRFAVGVDSESWWELAGGKIEEGQLNELTMHVHDTSYPVIPLGEDVPKGTVALVWRG